jgi:hypothetical protein
MDLNPELSLPEVRAAAAPGLVVIEWLLTPTADSAKRLAPALSRLIRASTTPIMLLTIAQGSSAPPNSETREILIREINALGKGLGGVALALEGSGFGVAAVRAIVSSIYIVTRPPYAVKVHSTVAESVAWMVGQWPKDGSKVTTREIEDAIARFRGR